MEISFEHDFSGGAGHDHTPALFNVAVVFGGAAMFPVNVVIVLDCSQSMAGYPVSLARDVIAGIAAKYQCVSVHAGRVPRVNPDEIRLTHYCNTVDAFRTARGFCLKKRRNHVVFITDGFIRADYSDFSRDGIPFHVINVGLGVIKAPHVWTVYDLISVDKCVSEFAAFIDETIFTGVSALITAADGVRITTMRAQMHEITPMKSYRVNIGTVTPTHVIFLRVSVRPGHAVPILAVRAASSGTFVAKAALSELSTLSPREYLGVEIMNEILLRLREAGGDGVIVDTATKYILARYPNTPELLAIVAMCRNEISYLSDNGGGLEADEEREGV